MVVVCSVPITMASIGSELNYHPDASTAADNINHSKTASDCDPIGPRQRKMKAPHTTAELQLNMKGL